MPITEVPSPVDTPEAIYLTLRLANGFGLKEMQRLVAKGVEALEKRKKQLSEEGIASDINQRLRVWNGTNGHVGVLKQLAEQLDAFLPKREPEPPAIDDGQVDAFAEPAGDPFDAAPVATDPTGRAPEMTPTGLRDLLANAHVYLPAVVIERTWDAEERLAAESWATAVLLERGGADVEVPERPEWCENYPLPEDYTRLDDGTVLGPTGRPMGADIIQPLWESSARKRIAPETVLPGAGPWRVVDRGVGEGLERYEVRSDTTGERMPVDPEWCATFGTTSSMLAEQLSDLFLAKEYAAYLSEQAQPAPADARPQVEQQERESAGGAGAAEGTTSTPAPFAQHSPDEDGDEDPAPAMVQAALAHAMYVVPVEVIAAWSAEDRAAAMEYGYAHQRRAEAPPQPFASEYDCEPLPDEPPVLVAIAWDVDPETGIAHHPKQRFNFTFANRRRPVRVLDTNSGRHYGDDWSMAEAERVLLAWSNAEPAEVRGETLQVRDARVAMEPVRGGAGGEG
jgi:hypothetical protein